MTVNSTRAFQDPATKPTKYAKRAERCLTKWMRRLPYLYEWTIAVTDYPQDLESCMSIEFYNISMEATLRVRPNAADLTPTEFEQCVLHEIGHLFFCDYEMVLSDHGIKREGSIYTLNERMCWRFARVLKAAEDA